MSDIRVPFVSVFTVVLALLSVPGAAVAAKSQKTVVIACDWDFAPYEFSNSNGKTCGFNIDIIDATLDALGIPHKYVMNARQQAVKYFRDGKADLIIDYSNRFVDEPYHRTRNVLEYSKISIAYHKSMQPLTTVSQLKGHTIMVNGNNDSIVNSPLTKYLEGVISNYQSPRDALGKIDKGQTNYYVWGKALLEWKIKELNLSNVLVSELDIPANEIHIVGYDKELIEDIDNQFARLQQSGQIDMIRERWFHPEKVIERTSSSVVYILLAALLLSILIYAIYRIIRERVRKALRHNQMTEAMMRQALSMGSFTVFVNDLRRNRVTNRHGNVLPPEGLTTEQMMERVHPDDRKTFMSRPKMMQEKPEQSHPFTIRWNIGTPDEPRWAHAQGYSFVEMKHHRPENIVIVSRDVTEQVLRQKRNRELTERYMKIFDSTLLAMSFYDKEGRLINLNENMKKLCGLNDQTLKFFWTTSIFDTDLMRGEIDPNSLDDFHTCQRMYYPELGIDKHIELTVHPIADEKKRLQYYVVTARNVTDERKMYLELQKQRKALNEASKTNQRYEKELRAMLENCNMYVWHADPKEGIIAFSRSLNSEEFTESFKEYLAGMTEEDRPKALENIQHIYEIDKPFNVVHRFNHTPVTDVPTWFAVSGMPLFDENGKLKSLFGLLRDITRLMEAQERLKEETARAENSAMLKSTFLANMTHEIRTPLNAIVGFSDLLQAVDSPEERKEFISIIRNNCDMLLRLINDIFEASTMDVKPLAIVPKKIDFAKEFAVVCQSLAQRVQEPSVKFITDQPYDTLVTTLDMGRMQQVITNFVTNAVKYTQQGHIRVGYCLMTEDNIPGKPSTAEITTPSIRPETNTTKPAGDTTAPPREGLYIFCEDTGTGIPKNQQARVFDRFVKLNDYVQGTGLGLAISKSIASRCNGHIGLISKGKGHGSTFWIWVPCTIITPDNSQ